MPGDRPARQISAFIGAFQMDRFRRERRADLWKLIAGITLGLLAGACVLSIIGGSAYLGLMH
jgi:hypothetical protein